MGDLTKDFSRWEFACKDNCGFEAADFELVSTLQKLRDLYGKIKINSGCRCKSRNAQVGGADESKHLMGIAADFEVLAAPPGEVARVLDGWFPNRCGIGVYGSWVHLDMRPVKARWPKEFWK